jgi:hypothetical protein
VNRAQLLRPTLLPGLCPLWRDSHTVQLGTDPAHAVVLELSHPAAGRLLELLDGARTEHAVLAEMRRLGMDAESVRATLQALIEAGVVVAAHTLLPTALPTAERKRLEPEAAALALRRAGPLKSPARILRRRTAARVIVAGDSRLARLIAESLQDAGVGTVAAVTRPGAVAETIPAGGTPHRRRLRATDADFVAQVGPFARVAARGARRRLPHLAITIRDAIAIVGPLVPATGGPCLRCLDLHRHDRDPAWPTIADQLATAYPDGGPCSAATRLAAAGLAVGEVLAYLDGNEPTTIGTTVEIDGVAPWRRRTWTPHSACDCTRRPR